MDWDTEQTVAESKCLNSLVGVCFMDTHEVIRFGDSPRVACSEGSLDGKRLEDSLEAACSKVAY